MKSEKQEQIEWKLNPPEVKISSHPLFVLINTFLILLNIQPIGTNIICANVHNRTRRYANDI